MGIAKDELARIWDPFYQVEAPLQRRHGGSGLGLAIVRRLVELHGGVVRAESEGENRGSRFTFTLPISPRSRRRPSRRLPLETTPIEPFLAGREILVVEDELQTQELVRVVIEDMLGGVARMCDDGEQSVREAAERPPALILLDLMLPRVSGWEVARRLRQSPRTATVPIVAVSALSAPAGARGGPARRLRRLSHQAVHARRAGSDGGRDAADLRRGRPVSTEAARILVVEDNRDTSVLLRELLEGEGYQVESEATGEAGWRAGAYARRRPDRARPDAAGHERLRGHRAAARTTRGGEHAHPGPERPVEPLGTDSRTARRRRRLHDQAVPARGAAGAHAHAGDGAAARPPDGRIQALEKIAEAALTVDDPEALLDRMVEVVVGVFDADAAAIFLFDEARGELRGRASAGLDGDLRASPRRPAPGWRRWP